MLQTERLLLAPLAPAAAALLLDSRERAAAELGIELAAGWPQPALLGILPRQVALQPSDAGWGIWLIQERAERLVIGDVGFHGPPSEEGAVEIGYSVVEPYRRRGYATEAARAVSDWARRQEAVSAVLAGCAADNLASIGTLRRLGFRQTGFEGDELRWRLAEAG
jgi:ribosomal-protein-alanine N-acetyltransferase